MDVFIPPKQVSPIETSPCFTGSKLKSTIINFRAPNITSVTEQKMKNEHGN